VLIITTITTTTTKYCQNNFNGKYCGIFGPKIARSSGDPDCRRTTVFVVYINSPVGESKQEATVDLDIRLR
jgi:hypothetical protein